MRSKIYHAILVLLCAASFVPISAKTASTLEFHVSSQWEYVQKRFSDNILAHGQAALVDSSGKPLGGIGFYCAIPNSYIDIFIHKPGGTLAQYFWGEPTFKTSLKFNNIVIPASVEHGIIYADINDNNRAVFAQAFELRPGVSEQRSTLDAANLGKFDLIVRAAPTDHPAAASLVVAYSRMTSLCEATRH